MNKDNQNLVSPIKIISDKNLVVKLNEIHYKIKSALAGVFGVEKDKLYKAAVCEYDLGVIHFRDRRVFRKVVG
jgi:hypothetical protein